MIVRRGEERDRKKSVLPMSVRRKEQRRRRVLK